MRQLQSCQAIEQRRIVQADKLDKAQICTIENLQTVLALLCSRGVRNNQEVIAMQPIDFVFVLGCALVCLGASVLVYKITR